MLRLGYLGRINNYYTTLCNVLENRNVEISSLECSWSNANSGNKFIDMLIRVRHQFIGTSDIGFLKRLNKYFTEYNPKVIVAFWGSNIIPDIIAIKKNYPNTKIILNVMCHPMGLSPIEVKIQNMHMKFAARYLDGFIFSSNEMKSYFEEKKLKKTKPYTIIPPLFSKKDFSKEYLPPCVNEPSIVYLGRPDWSKGQPSDDVGKQLDEVALTGLHVYYAGDIEQREGSSNRHIFKSMEISELSRFATQFDASLIIYNLEACKTHDRFINTIPDRLIASVSFGLPIAIPKKGYNACKEFLREYESIIEFTSYDDLYNQLNDKVRVNNLKKIAQKNSGIYSLESHVDKYLEFLNRIMK